MNKLSDKLEFIFNNTNEWLKYAEAKNTILFGFTAAELKEIL